MGGVYRGQLPRLENRPWALARELEDLYDVRSDPYQRRNLAWSNGAEHKRVQLRRLAEDLCDPAPPGYAWAD